MGASEFYFLEELGVIRVRDETHRQLWKEEFLNSGFAVWKMWMVVLEFSVHKYSGSLTGCTYL